MASFIPLFPGYLSVLSLADERWEVADSGRVVNWLDVPDQAGFWRDLQKIERLIESGMPITPEDRMEAGDPVVIRSGPLAGLEGTIVRANGNNRFLVQVNFIQRGASVVADDFDLAILN